MLLLSLLLLLVDEGARCSSLTPASLNGDPALDRALMLYIIALAIDALMALINYYALQKVWSNIEINGKCAHSLTDRLTLT